MRLNSDGLDPGLECRTLARGDGGVESSDVCGQVTCYPACIRRDIADLIDEGTLKLIASGLGFALIPIFRERERGIDPREYDDELDGNALHRRPCLRARATPFPGRDR